MKRITLALILLISAAPSSVEAQRSRQREGSLVRVQSIGLDGGAWDPAEQSLVRVGNHIITVGGVSGSMADNAYHRARVYRIRGRGTVAFVRKLPVQARALAAKGDTVYAIAFDHRKESDEEGGSGGEGGATTTHIEVFEFSDNSPLSIDVNRKPPLKYTRYMRCLTPVADGIAVAETLRPGDSETETIKLLSTRADKVLASHRFKTTRWNPSTDPYRVQMLETVMSLAANGRILLVRLADGRVRLLDLGDSLRTRHEIKLKGLGVVALSGQTLYAYLNNGLLKAYDVSNPDSPTLLWSRSIPKVSNAKGIVVDGERIIVHGTGMTEVWTNDAHPPTYFRVIYPWTTLECVIPNGDLIYAFNGGGSVAKLMTLRLVRPR
jgi:hypothetical protein